MKPAMVAVGRTEEGVLRIERDPFAFGGALTKYHIECIDMIAFDALSGRMDDIEALARIRVKVGDLLEQMEES